MYDRTIIFVEIARREQVREAEKGYKKVNT